MENYLYSNHYNSQDHFLKGLKKAVKKVGRAIDPTNKSSIIRKVGREIDVTAQTSGIREVGRKIDAKVVQPVLKSAKYAVLIPLQPVMVAALKAKGIKSSLNPFDIEQTAQKFYDNIVAKKGSNYEPIADWSIYKGDSYDHLTGDVIEAIVNFIKNGIQGQKEGKKQSDLMNQIADGAKKAIAKIEEKAAIVSSKVPTGKTITPVTVPNPKTGEPEEKIVINSGGVPVVVPPTVLGKELNISPWLIGGVLGAILLGVIGYLAFKN